MFCSVSFVSSNVLRLIVLPVSLFRQSLQIQKRGFYIRLSNLYLPKGTYHEK